MDDGPRDPPAGDDDTTGQPPDDDDDATTGDDDTPEPPLEQVPAAEGDPSDWLFALDQVQVVDIELSAGAVDSLWASPYEFVSGDVRVGDELRTDVGVRLKGKIGSFRDLNGKAAFKLDFNRFVEGQTLGGLERLNLNNMVQDCACVHERTAYDLFRAMGVPSPRVGYAVVRVNGQDYGLYSVVEVYDDVFLDRHYEDSTGNLYDGDYYLWPDWNYSLIDFTESQYGLIALDEGQDVGLVDVRAVVDAIAGAAQGGSFQALVGARVDLEHFARFWATDVWIGQHDGYVHYTNNYRVYFDPADGLAEILPWDPDWAFYEPTPVTEPYGVLAQGCKADPACHQHFLDEVAAVGLVAQDASLVGQLHHIEELIMPAVLQDPRREYSYDSVVACQQDLHGWLLHRAGVLAAMPGL